MKMEETAKTVTFNVLNVRLPPLIVVPVPSTVVISPFLMEVIALMNHLALQRHMQIFQPTYVRLAILVALPVMRTKTTAQLVPATFLS